MTVTRRSASTEPACVIPLNHILPKTRLTVLVQLQWFWHSWWSCNWPCKYTATPLQHGVSIKLC